MGLQLCLERVTLDERHLLELRGRERLLVRLIFGFVIASALALALGPRGRKLRAERPILFAPATLGGLCTLSSLRGGRTSAVRVLSTAAADMLSRKTLAAADSTRRCSQCRRA